MAEETPTTPESKPIPKAAPPPPGAGGPPKASPPPGAGGPPKAAPPPGTGGPPKAAAPPGAAPKPPTAAAPPPTGTPKPASVPPPSATPKPAMSAGPTPSTASAPAIAKPAAKVEVATSGLDEASVVTRREFLNYVWAGSMALFLVGMGGISFFFALPRPRPGEFGGVIPVNADEYRKSAELKAPIANNVGKFWISSSEKGIMALYKVCTHLGCIYPWSESAGRFQCPCHGSQFQIDGTYIAGPAPRNLDRFKFEIFDAGGISLAVSLNGDPVPLPDNAALIKVNTGEKTQGKGHF